MVPGRDGELLAPSCSYKESKCCEREQESGRLWNRVDGRVARLVGWSPAVSATRRSVAVARKVAWRPLAISRRGGSRNENEERGAKPTVIRLSTEGVRESDIFGPGRRLGTGQQIACHGAQPEMSKYRFWMFSARTQRARPASIAANAARRPPLSRRRNHRRRHPQRSLRRSNHDHPACRDRRP